MPRPYQHIGRHFFESRLLVSWEPELNRINEVEGFQFSPLLLLAKTICLANNWLRHKVVWLSEELTNRTSKVSYPRDAYMSLCPRDGRICTTTRCQMTSPNINNFVCVFSSHESRRIDIHWRHRCHNTRLRSRFDKNTTIHRSRFVFISVRIEDQNHATFSNYEIQTLPHRLIYCIVSRSNFDPYLCNNTSNISWDCGASQTEERFWYWCYRHETALACFGWNRNKSPLLDVMTARKILPRGHSWSRCCCSLSQWNVRVFAVHTSGVSVSGERQTPTNVVVCLDETATAITLCWARCEWLLWNSSDSRFHESSHGRDDKSEPKSSTRPLDVMLEYMACLPSNSSGLNWNP